MKQEEFAVKIGCKAGALRTYETGRTIPNELIQHNLCELYGITIDELNNQDLKTKQVNVINPDTKEVEFSLHTTHAGNSQIEQELADLKMENAELKAEIKTLKEFIEKLLEKR